VCCKVVALGSITKEKSLCSLFKKKIGVILALLGNATLSVAESDIREQRQNGEERDVDKGVTLATKVNMRLFYFVELGIL